MLLLKTLAAWAALSILLVPAIGAWLEEYEYVICDHCHGTWPADDVVEGVCIWCWQVLDDAVTS